MYLSFENLSVGYGKTPVLEDISFGISNGEIFGLIGPNGCGKTTILKTIIGLLKPMGGDIKIEEDISIANEKDLKRIVGYCPQKCSFFDKMTVRENIMFFANLYNTESEIGKVAADVAKSVNLQDKLDEFACNLSGGMRRRLNIACSIMHEPKILLLDEPTIELDPFSRMNVWRLIKEINKRGTTIIISTNAMEEAGFLCSNVAFLWKGKVQYTGKPEGIIKEIEKEVWRLE